VLLPVVNQLNDVTFSPDAINRHTRFAHARPAPAR
jgi:hypothetical protein